MKKCSYDRKCDSMYKESFITGNLKNMQTDILKI